MSRAAYIWIIASVVAAFLFHTYEESERREAIQAATYRGLYIGIKSGCENTNDLRDDISALAAELHPENRQTQLPEQNCHAAGMKVAEQYLKQARK